MSCSRCSTTSTNKATSDAGDPVIRKKNTGPKAPKDVIEGLASFYRRAASNDAVSTRKEIRKALSRLGAD